MPPNLFISQDAGGGETRPNAASVESPDRQAEEQPRSPTIPDWSRGMKQVQFEGGGGSANGSISKPQGNLIIASLQATGEFTLAAFANMKARQRDRKQHEIHVQQVMRMRRQWLQEWVWISTGARQIPDEEFLRSVDGYGGGPVCVLFQCSKCTRITPDTHFGI